MTGSPTRRQPSRGSSAGRASSSRRRISPGIVFLGVALVGSIAYALYAVTVREASQIPLLASGAVILAIVFGALAAYCIRVTWRAGVERRDGRALAVALIGGIAAIVAAGCLAGAIILFQIGNPPAA